MAVDRRFLPRVEPVFAWLYLGQPKQQWPKWFREHFGGQTRGGALEKHSGRYAVATIMNERKTFWRWFDAEKFRSLYIEEPRDAADSILATGLVAGEAEIRADIGSRSWGNDVIDTLSERKLTCRQLAEYIWHRAHKEPMCFEQNIARLIENERKQAADRARADEREKCAKVAERKFAGTLTSNIGLRIAAIRSGGGE